MTEEEQIQNHPDLLLKVLRCHPDLHIAAIVAAAVRERECAEFTCHDDFSTVSDENGRIRCGDMIVTLEQAKIQGSHNDSANTPLLAR